MKSILILTKKTADSGGPTRHSGMNNSAKFLRDQLDREFNIPVKWHICIDANSIDKQVNDNNATMVILEAIWVTPDKMTEIAKKWRRVKFVVRVHSKIPFLAYEGNAISWLKAYAKLRNVTIGFNSPETLEDFKAILPEGKSILLPNVYKAIDESPEISERPTQGNTLRVACLGAIRPFKNTLAQAFAAIKYADQNDRHLHFYVNAGRVEQRGESPLSNIRALFADTKHHLIELPWLTHPELEEVLQKMDIGLQVSLSESFNVTTADYVNAHLPIVVSKEVFWVNDRCKSDIDVNSIVRRMEHVLSKPRLIDSNYKKLYQHNINALAIWGELIL